MCDVWRVFEEDKTRLINCACRKYRPEQYTERVGDQESEANVEGEPFGILLPLDLLVLRHIGHNRTEDHRPGRDPAG